MFVKTDPDTDLPFTIGDTFIFSTWLTTVLATIIGTLMFTSEVQHGTIANAVAAQPARWVIVAAKTTIAAAFGLAMGVLGMIGGLSGAVARRAREGRHLRHGRRPHCGVCCSPRSPRCSDSASA